MKFEMIINWFIERPAIIWVLIFVYMLTIFIVSSIPYPQQPRELENKYAPVVEHIIEYSILGFLLFMGLISRFSFEEVERMMIIAILISAFYGVTDEVHQAFVPGRYSDIIDVFANFVGSVFGALLGNKILIKRYGLFPDQVKSQFFSEV